MEYTKDMILHVNYGQEEKKKTWNWGHKISSAITKHKMMTAVISITVMLMFLDIMLVTSFVQVLSSMSL